MVSTTCEQLPLQGGFGGMGAMPLVCPERFAHLAARPWRRPLGRADLLHTLAETAIGPVGRSVMLQPHHTSRRATITSTSLHIFEPLVPPHAMAALLQRFRFPQIHSREDPILLFCSCGMGSPAPLNVARV